MMATTENVKVDSELNSRNIHAQMKRSEYLPAIIAIVVLIIFGQIISPGFASFKNLVSIFNMASILIIVCIGQLVVMVGGNAGIDLSVGAVVSMGALIGTDFMFGKTLLIPLGIIAMLCFGAFVGWINGLGIQRLKIPALAMTLFLSTIVDGFTLAKTQGMPSLNVPSGLLVIGKPVVGFFCPILFITIFIVVVVELILRRSKFGKSLYLIGSNRRAALLCGISVNKMVILTYVISGAVACFAGLMLVGYTGSGQLKMGNDYTMMSIAAVVIGGTKVSGGKGTLIGAVLGSIVLVLLNSVLVAIGVTEGVREFIEGLILIIVLFVNCRMPSLRK